MTATAMLMREVETLPEEVAAEALDFVLFLQSRQKSVYRDFPRAKATPQKTSVDKMCGIFAGMVPFSVSDDFAKNKQKEKDFEV